MKARRSLIDRSVSLARSWLFPISIGAALALALAWLIVRAFASPDQPFLQVAETNQGALSLLALAAALAIAVYEHRRALAAADELRREYIDQVLGVIDHARTLAIKQADAINTGGSPVTATFEWNEAIKPTRFLLDALRSAPPRDAALAIAVTELWMALTWDLPTIGKNPAGIGSPKEVVDLLDEARSKIAARRA